MKNIELAKLLYEMKPGDPPSLHKGENWYTMWNSNTVEEAWEEAEKTGLIPDWEHDWIALKELLLVVIKNFDPYMLVSLYPEDKEKIYEVNFTKDSDVVACGYGFTLEQTIVNAIINSLP